MFQPHPPLQPPDERLPLYQKLRDQFAAKIASQAWRHGEAIPPETELAGEYRASIGTVRKAIETLVAGGMLERIHGKGTFVRRAKFSSSLFRFFRFHTDGSARVPEARILKRESAMATGSVAKALQIDVGTPVIHFSRLRVLDSVPLLIESIWLPRDRFAKLLKLKLTEFGDLLYPLYEAQCGQVIGSAKETLTAESVGPFHARVLGLKVGAPIIVIERLAFSYHQQPLEWRCSRGPADQFRYSVEIR